MVADLSAYPKKGSSMITLDETSDYWIMLAIVAGFGSFGGLVYDLLQTRGSNTGMLEILGRRERNRYFDLGSIASILVGAATAIVILYIFPPTITIDEGGNATTQYDLVALVALSIIVGSAGPSFLEIAQQRIRAAVNAQQARTKIGEGQTQVEQVGTVIAKVETENAIREALAQTVPDLEQALAESHEVPPEARSTVVQGVIHKTVDLAGQSFEERTKGPVDTAKKALSTPTEPSS